MADDDHGGHAGQEHAVGTHVVPKKKDNREAIIVITSIVGVLLAFLTFRRGSGATSASTTTAAPAAPSALTTGTVAGYSGSAADGLSTYLSNLSAELAQLEANTSSATSTGTSSAVPAFQFGPSAAADVYVQDKTGAIYQVAPTSGGGATFYHLSPQQYAAVGRPKPTQAFNFG